MSFVGSQQYTGRVSHTNLEKWPSSARVSRSSVVRAPNRYLGGHGFDSRRGLRIFSLSHARDKSTYHLYQERDLTGTELLVSKETVLLLWWASESLS